MSTNYPNVFWLLLFFSACPIFLSAQNNAQVITDGMIAWRTPDANGMACANCHAPDGLDLARFNFTDENIRRRDEVHLNSELTDDIIAMLHAIRNEYNLQPLDHLQDRPFQPAGQPVAGSTAQERDFNTTKQVFMTQLPTLFERIDTRAEAVQAQQEILNFNLRTQPCGIPFPRLSEDIFHGEEHGSLNDWLPDHPLIPHTAMAEDWYALQDAYLAHPTATNFWAMYNAVTTHLGINGQSSAAAMNNGEVMSQRKFQSTLMAQHLWREEALGLEAISVAAPMNFLEFPADMPNGTNTVIHDPFFDIGSRAHKRMPKVEEYAPIVQAHLSGDFDDDIVAMRLGWWYLGWTFNPFLDQIGNRHEYFPQGVFGHLSKTPYIIHSEFVHAKMDIERQFNGRVRRIGEDPRQNSPAFSRAISNFNPGFVDYEDFFFNNEHEQLYQTFSANLRRMNLLLMMEEIDQQCAEGKNFDPYCGDEVNFQEGFAAHILPTLADWESDFVTENKLLVEQAIDKMREGKRGCGTPVPADGSGIGLTTEIYDELDFTDKIEERIDARLNYYEKVSRNPLISSAAGQGVAVRWTGYIEPRFTETYTLHTRNGQHSTPSVRVTIDGEVLTEYWEGELMKGRWHGWSGDKRLKNEVDLVAGERHEIMIEYTETEDDQGMRLMWESPSQLIEVIPQSQLYPAAQSLPLELISFAAKENSKTVELNWQITNAQNVAYFQIEKSTLEQPQKVVGQVSFSTKNNGQFSFIDTKIEANDQQYRLKIVDLDGQFSYSNWINTSLKTQIAEVEIYPNPSSDVVQIKLDADSSDQVHIQLFNSNGQLVNNQVSVGNQLQLDLRDLPVGVYWLKIGNRRMEQLIKQ